MRIAGLDQRARRRRCRAPAGVARAVLTERQKRARRARRTLAAPRPRRGHHLVVHPARRGEGVRRRRRTRSSSPTRSRREMSSMRPSLLPGLLAALQAQPQPRLRRCGAVRGRPGLSRRRARGSISSRPPACAPAPPSSAAAAAIGTARRQGRRPVRRQGRRVRACWPRSASMPPRRRSRATRRPGTTRAAPARCGSAPRSMLAHFGELHPATLKALDVAGAGRRLRGVPRRAAGAEGQEPRQAAPRGRRPAARAPRLRLRARSRRCRPATWCALPPAPTRR